MTVVLYGATGYTGRLVTDELVRRRLPFTLAGRNADKLARLSDERAGGAPWRSAPLDDEAGLRGLLADAGVVIHCAGPFARTGDAIVRAALETGTHYVDSTGEQGYIRRVFEQHGPEAERRGVALVPALGFDYAFGDTIAGLAGRGGEPLEQLVVAYALSGFGMSRGTMRSGLDMATGGEVVYEEGDWRPAPAVPLRATFDFPEPIGRRPVTRLPSGEVVTVPRHTRTRRLVSLMTARTFAPAPAPEALVPLALPLLSLALRTPLRAVLDKAVGALPEGPSEAARRRSSFTIVAEARGAGGFARRGVVHGSDVYGLTARTLVWGAERLLEPGFGQAGALGPAAAFDPAAFLDAFAAAGLGWSVESG